MRFHALRCRSTASNPLKPGVFFASNPLVGRRKRSPVDDEAVRRPLKQHQILPAGDVSRRDAGISARFPARNGRVGLPFRLLVVEFARQIERLRPTPRPFDQAVDRERDRRQRLVTRVRIRPQSASTGAPEDGRAEVGVGRGDDDDVRFVDELLGGDRVFRFAGLRCLEESREERGENRGYGSKRPALTPSPSMMDSCAKSWIIRRPSPSDRW